MPPGILESLVIRRCACRWSAGHRCTTLPSTTGRRRLRHGRQGSVVAPLSSVRIAPNMELGRYIQFFDEGRPGRRSGAQSEGPLQAMQVRAVAEQRHTFASSLFSCHIVCPEHVQTVLSLAVGHIISFSAFLWMRPPTPCSGAASYHTS